MDLKMIFQLVWKNKTQISEGLYNTYLNHKPQIEEEAQRRIAICETNQCGYYDKDGKPETSVVPGKPACSKCHCNIQIKCHCISCWCSMGDEVSGDRKQMENALWTEMIDNEIDRAIKQYEYEQQFKR